MHSLTRLLIDDSVVVESSETSVDDFDGYALTLTAAGTNVTLAMVGTAPQLRALARKIATAVPEEP
jgi:hypothetical protein